MNKHMRTRWLAVVGAGTAAGLLAGTGLAFGAHTPAPPTLTVPTVACGSVEPGGQVEGRWFGHTQHVAL